MHAMQLASWSVAIVFVWILFFVIIWRHTMRDRPIFANWVDDGKPVDGLGAEPLARKKQ